jgi:hypothetical protein
MIFNINLTEELPFVIEKSVISLLYCDCSAHRFKLAFTTVSKKYPNLGQKKSCIPGGGGAQLLIPVKVGPM